MAPAPPGGASGAQESLVYLADRALLSALRGDSKNHQ